MSVFSVEVRNRNRGALGLGLGPEPTLLWLGPGSAYRPGDPISGSGARHRRRTACRRLSRLEDGADLASRGLADGVTLTAPILSSLSTKLKGSLNTPAQRGVPHRSADH